MGFVNKKQRCLREPGRPRPPLLTINMCSAVLALVAVMAVQVSARAEAVLADTLKTCAAIGDNPQRLACFDAAVAHADRDVAKLVAERNAAEALRTKEAADRAEAARASAAAVAAKAKTDAFGAEGMPAIRAGDDASAASATLQVNISEVLVSPLNKLVFLLDNGQMWRQTDSVFLQPVRAGEVAVIKKRLIGGGYRLTLQTQKKTIDVKRFR